MAVYLGIKQIAGTSGAGGITEDHLHEIADVNGLQTELDSKLETIPAHTHTTADITDFAAQVAANIPAEYLTTTEGNAAYQTIGAAPTAHTHTFASLTTKPTTLAGYGITDAATKTYVDTADNFIINTLLNGKKIWTGTQAAYTAIGTKDAGTLYFITGV